MSGDKPDCSTPYYAAKTPTGERVSSYKRGDTGPDDALLPESLQPQPASDSNLVPLSQLFAYADGTDKLLMLAGTIGAFATGFVQPLQMVLLGNVLNAFNPQGDQSGMLADIKHASLNFVYVGVGVIFTGFLQAGCWSATASRQAKRIRSAYVRAIVAKEIGWFDVNDSSELPTRIAESAVIIQEGIGAKFGESLHFLSLAVSGIAIGLVKGWELTLVLLAFIPVMALGAFLSTRALTTATQLSVDAYAHAGALAEESLSNIRTVHMFNLIKYFAEKYELALENSVKAGIKKGFAVGWGTGLMYFISFSTFAFGLFYGALKVANDHLDGNNCTGSNCYDGGRVLTVFFAVIMGATALGQAGPSVQALISARAAAYNIFAVIDRETLIDPFSDDGRKLDNVHGAIHVDNVTFAYPSRPEATICSNYSLTIHAGETIALVGPSGSGKSTIISLLERFYDPQIGSIHLDGCDLRQLNVKWLRQQIGLVGQEPTLFATSITENIRYGKPTATDEEVIAAAKAANAFNFIMAFSNGFATEVGERGTQLSGGQKQRIAIARAIVNNPPVLLLDEATSALDTESERVVQESLDRLLESSTRTTIIVAHRLSTVRNADRIAVHSGGSIVELGSHDELMHVDGGIYRKLVETQARAPPNDDPFSDSSEKAVKASSGLMIASTATGTALPCQSAVMSEPPTRDTDISTIMDGENAHEESPPVSMSRVWRMAIPEWRFLAIGSCGAVVNAAVFPVWGILMTKVMVLYFQYDKTKHEMLTDARYWSLGFVGIAITFGVSITVQHYGFAVASQRLVCRVRMAQFSAMLRQDMGWFDLPENSSGALISRLAMDSATLQTMTSDSLNRGLVNATSLLIGFAIALYFSWQMTLIVLATTPIFAASSFMQQLRLNGQAGKKNKNEADVTSGALLAEAIGSIRTVASLSLEQILHHRYTSLLEASMREDMIDGAVGGLAFGFSMGVILLCLAFLFYISGRWVSHGTITFEEMFMVLMVLMLSTFAVGMTAQSGTDGGKAKRVVHRIFETIDRTPTIDANSATGEVLPHVDGTIEFRNVQFAYPARPDVNVYKNYSLMVASGQIVALVGASGSGKSTAVSLLDRFYDPLSGEVMVDGKNIRELNLPWLRNHIAVVSQEPVLFAGSIADNIALGRIGATREEVMEAARKANALDFISNFPDGFDTQVGDRGSQVSGGQKQRIAIARAILRNPQILVLDEATSALDAESERIVQESLDTLLTEKRQTIIVVAHRLSTIRNADVIAVTQGGAIAELGTHNQLLQIPNGLYKALVNQQSLN